MLTAKQWKTFFIDLYNEIFEDHIDQGAAALGYYLTFSIFPALIALLSVIAYLPVENLADDIMSFLNRVIPNQSAELVRNVVVEVTSQRRGGLLSLGLLAAVWSASRGMGAVFQQMTIVYKKSETRSFLKFNGVVILVTLFFGLIIVLAFTAMATQAWLRNYLVEQIGFETFFVILFDAVKWATLALISLAGFAAIYYYGPNAKIPFRWVTPGSLFGVAALGLSAYLITTYLGRFLDFSATYGSIGAVILLMLWFYIIGWILLLGAEMNSILESYSSGRNTAKKKKLDEDHQAQSSIKG